MKRTVIVLTLTSLVAFSDAVAAYEFNGSAEPGGHPPGLPNFPNVEDLPGKRFSEAPDRVRRGREPWPRDPGRVNWFDGIGGTWEGPDYVGPAGPHSTGEIDAVADRRDALFDEVIANRAELVFSVEGSGGIIVEQTNGLSDTWARAVDVREETTHGDLDALAFWGAEPLLAGPPALWERAGLGHSLAGDPYEAAVFDWEGRALVRNRDLARAVATLLGEPASAASLAKVLDIDAMMLDEVEGRNKIVFSVAPTTIAGGAVTLDGGEIFVWDGVSPSATFLEHGGHRWDTAFPVRFSFGGPLGLPSENINAIEAIGLERHLEPPPPPIPPVPPAPPGRPGPPWP